MDTYTGVMAPVTSTPNSLPRTVPHSTPISSNLPAKWGGVLPGAYQPATPQPQKVSYMEILPEGGEDTRGSHEEPRLDEHTASLNPRDFEDDVIDYDPHNTIQGSIVKPPPNPGIRLRTKGRLLAVILRIEFDPSCMNLTYAEKATLAGLSAPDEYLLVQKYKRILNSLEFVGQRRVALNAFEAEMDVSTAICIALAAKQDPQIAILRRRLRQMDERRQISGDQREQFARIMAFLHGETETVRVGGNNNGERTAGEHDRQDTESSRLVEQDNTEPDGLEQAGITVSEGGESEAGEEQGD